MTDDDKLQRRLAGWALSPSVQAERAERRRLEMRQRAEQQRLEMQAQREHEQRREQDARERQRLAALEREWRTFKTGVVQAQQEHQRKAAFQHRQQLLDELGQIIRPPPAARSGKLCGKLRQRSGGQRSVAYLGNIPASPPVGRLAAIFGGNPVPCWRSGYLRRRRMSNSSPGFACRGFLLLAIT